MPEAALKTAAAPAVAKTSSSGHPSCSVLVVSCDKYRDLWPPFFHLFWQHWPDCPFPVYLGTNCETLDDARVGMLHSGPDESWSKSLRFFLSQIDTDYVLVLLEDFFLDGGVPNHIVMRNLDVLHALHGKVLRLNPNPPPNFKVPEYAGVAELHRRAPYRVSAQPSIWNRLDLLSTLQDDESAWQFERQGSVRSESTVSGYFCTIEPSFPHRHVVEQGKWFWSAAKYYRAQNIGCDFTARPAMALLTEAKKIVSTKLRRLRVRLLALTLTRRNHETTPLQPATSTLRVALLTNLIAPYHKPVLDSLSRRYGHLRLLLSVPMEANRPWKLEWDGLDVVVQKTITVKGRWRHPRGFNEPLSVHFPLDTLQQLGRFKPQVVISAEMGARTLLAIVYRKLHPQSRLIVWAEAAESTERGRGLARQIMRRVVCRNADAFLAVGGRAVEYLRHLGADRKTIYKIAYTTELTKFTVNPANRSRAAARKLLFSGQLVERKGLAPFLKVLSEWADAHPESKVECQIAGGGPLQGALSEMHLAANMNLDFLGVFQYDALPHVYNGAGILMLPTLADTWGVVVNEALASGLLVLGSVYAQAVEELIQDGRNGWTFRPDREDEVYAAIDRMMSASHEDLDRMRSYARSTAMNLSPDRVAGLIDIAVTACLQ